MDVKSIISDLGKSVKSAKASHNKTKSTVTRLDQNIYLMDYRNDYYLDEILNKGCSSIGELIGYAAKKFCKDFVIGSEKGSGCTTFEARNESGDHLLARNFDFKEAPCFILWTHPEGRYSSISMVDNNFILYGKKHAICKKGDPQALLAPYCCVDGMNDQGLAIAVLQIRAAATKQTDKSKKDITTTLMIRAVLDTCANVDEAIELIRSYNMIDSLFTNYHYQLCDSSGRSVVVEYINNELKVYERNSEKYPAKGSIFEDDGLDFQYVCNYSVTKDTGDWKALQHGHDRTDAVIKAMTEKNGIMSEIEAMDLLGHIRLKYDHPKYPWKIVSLWSIVYNTNERSIKIAANAELNRIYTFSLYEPLRVLDREYIRDSAYPVTEWEYL
ncbi:MAG: linear amide C-N hydrolase [Clostridia bacterium]|nr:linear amide C-N hydrolase [Clostridia bacterium]